MACAARPTGVEQYARAVVGALTQLPRPDGLQLHLYLAPNGLPDLVVPDWIRLHRRPECNTRLKPLWLIYRAWRDRLRVFFTFTNDTPGWIPARRVATVWDTIFDEFPDSYAPGLPRRYRAETARAARRHPMLMTLAENTADSLRRRYAFRGRVMVLGGGARTGHNPETPSDQPFEADLSTLQRPFFFTLGRIDRRKNLVRVVRAYRRLVREGFRGGLLLAGPRDSGWPELEAALHEDPVAGESIVLSDYLSDHDVQQCYRQCLAFVYPSLAEGLGLPILEALACATPTIAADRSPMRELLGEAGLLIQPEEVDSLAAAMGALARESELCRQLSLRGPEQAARFTWKGVAERLLAQLLELAQAKL